MRGKPVPFKWSNLLSYFRPAYPTCQICKRGRKPDEQVPCCVECAAKMSLITKVNCVYCGRPSYCPDCIKARGAHQPVPSMTAHRSAAEYDSWLKHCIALYKYRGQERMQDLLGNLMVHAYHLLEDHLRYHQKESNQPTTFDVITFVPISGPRAQERGFNQAEQLAVQLGQQTGLPVVPLLFREKHAQKQSQQDKAGRRKALLQVYAFHQEEWDKLIEATPDFLRPERKINIIIVDDVYTTGSTMEACAEVLVGHVQAEVYGLTLGRA